MSMSMSRVSGVVEDGGGLDGGEQQQPRLHGYRDDATQALQGHSPLYPFTHSSIHHSSIHPFIYSSIHPFTHLSIYPFIHSPIYPFTHSSIYSFIPSPNHSFTHSFIQTFIHLSIHPFIHPFIHSPIHPFNHSFIYPFIYSPRHPFTRLSIHPFIQSPIHSLTRSSIHLYLVQKIEWPIVFFTLKANQMRLMLSLANLIEAIIGIIFHERGYYAGTTKIVTSEWFQKCKLSPLWQNTCLKYLVTVPAIPREAWCSTWAKYNFVWCSTVLYKRSRKF